MNRLRALTGRPRLAAFLLYLGISTVMFGLPLLEDPSVSCLCARGNNPDPTLYMWGFAWIVEAIEGLHNPFLTDALFAPEGANLAQATFVPGPGLLAAPLTALGGPIVAHNAVMLLSPALAAFTAFLLCRRLTDSIPAALVGGYLFGFSSYELGQMTGHMNLSLVFLLPALVHLALMHVDGDLSTRPYVALTAAALLLQLLTSAEVLVGVTLFGWLALGAAWLLFPERRERLRSTALALGASYLVMAVAGSPFLWQALSDGGAVVEANRRVGVDSLSFLVPMEWTWLGGLRFFPTSVRFRLGWENGAYLGLPVLIGVVAYLVGHWRRPSTKLLAFVLAATALAALGPRLLVRGEEQIPLPWAAVNGFPVLDKVTPLRFVVFTTLAAAVAFSLWLARAGVPRSLKVGAAAAAIVVLLPRLSGDYWQGRLDLPAFWTGDGHSKALSEGEVVLLLPAKFTGRNMLWHATDMRFRQASGYLGENGRDPERGSPLYPALRSDNPTPANDRDLTAYLRRRRVRTVVLSPAHRRWASRLTAIGLRGRLDGGMLVFDVPPGRTRGGARESPLR